MKRLWKYMNQKPWKANTKFHATLLVLSALAAVAGLAVWLVVRCWALSTWDWMVCFVGYPAIALWLAGYLYLCNHEYQSGRTCR